MGQHERSASTAAGKRLLTAVPEVVMTTAALPEAALMPKAKKPETKAVKPKENK